MVGMMARSKRFLEQKGLHNLFLPTVQSLLLLNTFQHAYKSFPVVYKIYLLLHFQDLHTATMYIVVLKN